MNSPDTSPLCNEPFSTGYNDTFLLAQATTRYVGAISTPPGTVEQMGRVHSTTPTLGRIHRGYWSWRTELFLNMTFVMCPSPPFRPMNQHVRPSSRAHHFLRSSPSGGLGRFPQMLEQFKTLQQRRFCPSLQRLIGGSLNSTLRYSIDSGVFLRTLGSPNLHHSRGGTGKAEMEMPRSEQSTL